MKKVMQIVIVNILLFLILFCFVELSLLAIVNTKLLMYMPRGARMSLYNESRNIIQFLPGCAEYDPELTYVLKKNSDFIFENIEYRTRYRTNSLGLRDDEKSLWKPEIIVLGDSFAMGWGVEQDETYAKIIEKKYGLPTLNAGISSYGTVREMKFLNRIDTTHLKYLIIQYCENDIIENYQFYKNNFNRKPMREEWYLDLQNKYGYHFGKYSRTLARFIKNNIVNASKNSKESNEIINTNSSYKELGEDSFDAMKREADIFLYILKNYSNIDYTKTKVIVLELSEPSRYTGLFLRSLKDKISEDKSCICENIWAVDMMSLLNKNDFYRIDEHINRNGHMKVADALFNEINRLK